MNLSSLYQVLALLTTCLRTTTAMVPPLTVQRPGQQPYLADNNLVPVVLGVMSKCPDALTCEYVWDTVLDRIGQKINMTLTYVAKVDPDEPDYGVTCMHGPEECAGNIQQLCVAKYADQQTWWDFVQCMNYQGKGKIGSTETALKCAKATRIDWNGSPIGDCTGPNASGLTEEGRQLLVDSIQATNDLSITRSCTVVISGEQRCIRDEGRWKECEDGHLAQDFIQQVNAEYNKINSPAL